MLVVHVSNGRRLLKMNELEDDGLCSPPSSAAQLSPPSFEPAISSTPLKSAKQPQDNVTMATLTDDHPGVRGMGSEERSALPSKVCFVTIGATASFNTLISHTVSTSFAQSLQSANYTDLIVQYGADGKTLFDARKRAVENEGLCEGVNITGFPIDRAGLGRYMRMAKTGRGVPGTENGRGAEGVVVSHAGRKCRSLYVGSVSLAERAHRLRHHSRRTTPRCPVDRRAKHGASGQPPGRACGSAGGAGICGAWRYCVSSTSIPATTRNRRPPFYDGGANTRVQQSLQLSRSLRRAAQEEPWMAAREQWRA